MWVGVDDTDSPKGGCTTFVLTELVDLARRQGLDLIGDPRLVRLNPNIPWRTRGNAALSARFGHGTGRRVRVGWIGGRSVGAYARGHSPTAEERERFLDAAWSRVERATASGGPDTDPALVAVAHRLPARVYWSAVRRLVSTAEAERDLEAAGAWVRWSGTRRGLVGAAAAVAWPGRRPTWELIAYREPHRWGTTRQVDAPSVRQAQRRFPNLFLCYDARTRRLLVAPHTPCPILFGLRATDPRTPWRALPLVSSEPVERWLTFRTNQGTGDHLDPRPDGAATELTSAVLRGSVVGPAVTLPGGHARFELEIPERGSVRCVAFEPTKTLPRIARGLAAGDRLRVWGSFAADRSLHLEGIEVRAWAAVDGRFATPSCPTCGRSTESAGALRGFRCRRCRVHLPPEAARAVVRRPPHPLGTYHPTASARRHLAPRAPET